MNSKQFLKEGFLEDAQEAHSDHEVQMARVDCYYAAEHAIVLHKLLRNISEEQGLEGWVASKITLANDYLKSVREHLEYQMMNVDAGEDDFLPLAEGLKPVKKNSVVESTASVAEDEEEKFQDFERGPWYVILKGKAVTVNGVPKKFNWLNGAKTYFRSMMDKNPEMAQKIKREYDEASDKKSVIYYTKNLPADNTTSTEQPVSEGEKPGLWANIRAKRKRIKGGSGERMRKPGSKGAPSDKDLKSIRAASESVVKEGDLHSDFGDIVQKVKGEWEAKRAKERQGMGPKYAPEQSRAELESRLRDLESEFDPAYQYSDDYSFWTKQNAIAREIASIKKKLGSQGVAEGNGDPDIKPGMRVSQGTVVKVDGNTVTVKASNGELTTVNIHDIQQGVAKGSDKNLNEMNPYLVQQGLEVVIDFLSKYPTATAVTAGAAGAIAGGAIIKKLVTKAWQNHKELEQLKQDILSWSYQKLHANKNVGRMGGKVAKIIQKEIERRKQNLPEQGVAEGSSDDLVYISVDRVEAFEDWMDSEGLETNVPKTDEGTYVVYDYSNADYRSKMYASDWNEKKGVAEGFSDVVKGIKRSIKGKEHPDVVASKHAGRAIGHYNQGDIAAGDKETNRYVKTRDMHLKAKGVAKDSGPQVGDEVYYGNRLVGWFKGYSKLGKIITEPNVDEMGDEYLSKDAYWDPQDKLTIKPKQDVAEGYKNTYNVGDRVDSPLGTGTIVAVSKNVNVDGRVKVKLDDPSRAGEDGKYKDSFVLNTTQLKHISEQGVAEATGNTGLPHDFTAVQPGAEVWYKGRFAGWTTGKVYDDPYGKAGKMVAFEPNPSEFPGDDGRILSLPYDEVSLRKSTSIGKLKGQEQGVAEGSDSNTKSHLDAFKSETDTMKPGTKKYVGRKDGKEVYAKKDAQGNVKFYHRDGIKGPLKSVAEGFPYDVDHMPGPRKSLADVNKTSKYVVATNAIGDAKEHRVTVNATSKNNAMNLALDHFEKKGLKARIDFDGLRLISGVAEGTDQKQLDQIVSKTDTVLQSSGMKRQGFDVVPDATQSGVRGSITPDALNMVKSNLARAKNISTTAGVKPSPDPVPLKQPWQVTNKDFGVNESKVDEACWKGYRKEGMKTMFGKKYPNCVKNTKKESVSEGSDNSVEALIQVYNNRDQKIVKTKVFRSEDEANRWADRNNATILKLKDVAKKSTIDETTAGSIAGVVNPKIKNKSKVGTLFGGTYKQQKDK